MKKITLKISAFLIFTMIAFQAQAQVTEIVEGTKYNLRNAGTGKYLQAVNIDGSKYGTVDALIDGEVTFNFTFNHHNTIDPGADTVLGTEDDVVHNYTDDWNIGNDTRGIMRSANTALVHTNFQYNRWNANGGHKTDKRWIATTQDIGVIAFRFAAAVSGDTDTRYLFDDGTGIVSNITEADMGDATAQQASLWVLTEATNTLSTKSFDVNAFSISNPVNDELTIRGATSKVKEVSLYSVLGNKVLSKTLNDVNGDLNLNVSALSTGLYIVKMTGKNGERFTKKIIKQ
jgi:hypothetical protein